MTGPRRVSATRVGATYAARLTAAHLTAAAAVLLVIVVLADNTVGDVRRLFTTENLIAFIVLVSLSAAVDSVVGIMTIRPTFRWFASGADPTPQQQRAALRIPVRQTAIEFGVWIVSGAVFVALNLHAPGGVAFVIGGAILFGAMTTACIGYLVTARTLRPIIAAAMKNSTARVQLPGPLGRLLYVWVLFSVLPAVGVVLIVLGRSRGWFLQTSAPIERPILVLVGTSLVLGISAAVLVARSISDPVHEVVLAMRELERGRPAAVDVYEPSEIGRLQSGFNSMVAGLAERERLRDLFGRYVGTEVAQQALEHGETLRGDVREVGVLFVDLLGSTTLAASRPPEEVARILNEFFQIVVSAVEDDDGLVNKFQGDAVLAVYGAPLPLDNPAASALRTARKLAPRLRRLPGADFGIGVSCGPVFAGTIGGENRYEYTVIGDPVNEAARLADRAKHLPSRVLASGAALSAAPAGEQTRWATRGSELLRGRAEPTRLAEPRAR
ncbi:adenylate/guanylate cyclase domain-containing protein [Mycolicibacterium thermoresistibile]